MKKIILRLTNNEYSFSVIAKIISVITGLLYSILFARYLGAELRGSASVILNYSEMLSLVLCMGMYQAYPYFKKSKGKDIYMEYINIVFGKFLLFLMLCVVVIFFYQLETNIVVAVLISPLLMGIKELNYVVLIENPKIRNMANIQLDLFDIIFLLVLLIATTANYSLCIFFIVIKELVFFVIAINNLKIRITSIRPTLKGLKAYAQYGFIPMVTVIMMEINYKIDVLMLDWFSVPVADIGIYALGVMLAQRLWMIPDALKDILLSKLTKGKTASEVAKVSRISFTILFVMVCIMIVIGKPLIIIMYGNEYADAYGITLVILAGVLGMIFYKMVYSYNVVNGHKNLNFILLSIAALLNILINVVTIPFYGTMGAAVASLISCSACGYGFLFQFCKESKIKIHNMILIKKEDIEQVKNMLKK